MIAIGFMTPNRLTIIRLADLDPMAWGLIVALGLAVMGMAIDAALGLVVGTVALPLTALALILVFALLFSELRIRRPLNWRPVDWRAPWENSNCN